MLKEGYVTGEDYLWKTQVARGLVVEKAADVLSIQSLNPRSSGPEKMCMTGKSQKRGDACISYSVRCCCYETTFQLLGRKFTDTLQRPGRL